MFATSSPRRVELSRDLNCVKRGKVTPLFISPKVNEVTVGEPTEIVTTNAKLKGDWAAERYPKLPVLAFDTTVAIGNEIFGKPKNYEDAKNTLRMLCGGVHNVYTAVCLIYKSKTVLVCEKTLVAFNEYDEKVINDYVESGAPMGKAGGYNIQDEPIKNMIKEIKGNVDNVIGLPLELTDRIIKENLL